MQFQYLNNPAYYPIKNYIIYENCNQGETISEAQVRNRYPDFSQKVIQEAFLLLEYEKLILREFRKGYRIAHISPRRLQDVYELRQILEPLALEKGMQNIDRSWLLETRSKFISVCTSPVQDNCKIVQLDNEFHMVLMMSVKNQYAARLLECCLDYLSLIRMFMLKQNKKCRPRYQEHTELIDVILMNDRQKAMRLMSEHLDASYQQVQRLVLAIL